MVTMAMDDASIKALFISKRSQEGGASTEVAHARLCKEVTLLRRRARSTHTKRGKCRIANNFEVHGARIVTRGEQAEVSVPADLVPQLLLWR
jgi:hypothetical protein